MRVRRILAGMVVACGIVGTVQADTLISGPVYGGLGQTHVACVVVNAGTAPIHFVTTELLGQYVAPLPLNYNDCRVSLLPGAICSFQAATLDHQATACKVSIVEAKTNVRGTMMALSPVPTNANVSEADLR